MGAGLRTRAGAVLAAAALVSGCGGDDEPPTATERQADRAEAPGRAAERQRDEPARPGASAPLPDPPSCVDTSSGCEQAAGRIIYVERVDPDGDGDAHFVLASEQSITAPGISVIDVRADLRPRPLPGPGDTLAASGPVFRGSYGQRQIQADAITVGGR